MAKKFKLTAKYKPAGDQPKAINEIVKGLNNGLLNQTLLGVTGSGKTFTMANVIQEVQRPAIVMAHNKTLAAQLYGEFKEYFPSTGIDLNRYAAVPDDLLELMQRVCEQGPLNQTSSEQRVSGEDFSIKGFERPPSEEDIVDAIAKYYEPLGYSLTQKAGWTDPRNKLTHESMPGLRAYVTTGYTGNSWSIMVTVHKR